MYDLRNLSLRQFTECGRVLRSLHVHARTAEEVCHRIAVHLYDHLRDGSERACVLARVYMTLPFSELDDGLRQYARSVSPEELSPATQCLTLLGTAGVEPAWNDRRLSRGHRTIPLPGTEALQRLPMVAGLIHDLGVSAQAVIDADPHAASSVQNRTFDVFYVAEAAGSPAIPAQDFVAKYGVRSVLGFGAMLPNGELFAVILFARIPVSREVSELFRPLSLAAKLSLLPFGAVQRFQVQHA